MSYLIKKYANRKLYDTVRRSYTTLAEIAELVRTGRENIEVREEATGRDITGSIMAQIILEDKKGEEDRRGEKEAPGQKSGVSIDALKKLIREGEESVREFAERYAPRVSSSFKSLVEEGRRATTKGRQIIKDEASDVLKELQKIRRRIAEKYLEGAVQAVNRHGLTRKEVLELTTKIDELNRKLDLLDGKRRPPKGRVAPVRKKARRASTATATKS